MGAEPVVAERHTKIIDGEKRNLFTALAGQP